MATVTLADVPKSAHELEDYVAALLQAAGYFVESDVTEKDFTEILQLDAIATSYEMPEHSESTCSMTAAKRCGNGSRNSRKVIVARKPGATAG